MTIALSAMDVVAGTILLCVPLPGAQAVGASMLGAGLGGIAGGYVSEAMGGSFETGAIIGGIVGAIVGGSIYRLVQHLRPIDVAKMAQETGKGEVAETAVIGKMKDLDAYQLKPGEYKVADMLPDLGNPKLNWKQNSSALREIMRTGNPIRDVSAYPMSNAGFLGAERNLLQSKGWQYHNGFWIK